MAVVRCGKQGVSLGIADIDTFLLGEHTNQSSTHFTSSLLDYRFEIFGSFGYVNESTGLFPGLRAHTGVVKGWSAFRSDELSYSITGVSRPLERFGHTGDGLSNFRRWSDVLGTNDKIYGSQRKDGLNGFDGDDRIYGGGGSDFISGDRGNDVLLGGSGRDDMHGGRGNDIFYVDGRDVVSESANQGIDTVRASASFKLTADAAIEHLTTISRSQTKTIHLTGNAFANSIIGNAGTNRLRGLDGDDVIKGLHGDDILDGGNGSDVLVGGTGRDTFILKAGLDGSSVDTVVDFSPDDTISLAASTFPLAPGGLISEAFSVGSAAQDADDRILYDPATGLLSYDADGSGAGAAIAFARLGAGLSLTSADFVVA